MKANEAPEKIYVPIKDGKPFGMWQDIPWRDHESIEYIRTDAFVEKTLEFFENDLCCYIKAKDFTIEHERLETDFKKAMKV